MHLIPPKLVFQLWTMGQWMPRLFGLWYSDGSSCATSGSDLTPAVYRIFSIAYPGSLFPAVMKNTMHDFSLSNLRHVFSLLNESLRGMITTSGSRAYKD